jgi:hypothetical protein
MRSSIYKKAKFIVYIICLIIIMIQKLFIINKDTYLIAEMYPKLFMLPCILLISLFYFHYQYYNNIFIKTRFNDYRKYIKSICIDILKECITLALFQFFIIMILDLKMLKGYSILSLFSIILDIILVYCLLGMIYLLIYFLFNKYHICFIVDSIVILVHYLYVIYWLMYGAFLLDDRTINERWIISLICILIIVLCFIVIYVRTISTIKVNQMLLMIISYFFIELLSMSYLKVYTIDYSLFSFSSLELLNQSEMFTVSLFWLIPKFIVLYIIFKKVVYSYHHNLLFYMVRISNRFIWIKKLYKEIIKYLITFTVIKIIDVVIVYRTLSLQLLISGMIYILYMSFLSSIIITMYFILKDESIFNYFIFLYIAIFFINIIMNISKLSFISIDYHYGSISIYFLIIIILYIISVYIINHDEYYG